MRHVAPPGDCCAGLMPSAGSPAPPRRRRPRPSHFHGLTTPATWRARNLLDDFDPRWRARLCHGQQPPRTLVDVFMNRGVRRRRLVRQKPRRRRGTVRHRRRRFQLRRLCQSRRRRGRRQRNRCRCSAPPEASFGIPMRIAVQEARAASRPVGWGWAATASRTAATPTSNGLGARPTTTPPAPSRPVSPSLPARTRRASPSAISSRPAATPTSPWRTPAAAPHYPVHRQRRWHLRPRQLTAPTGTARKYNERPRRRRLRQRRPHGSRRRIDGTEFVALYLNSSSGLRWGRISPERPSRHRAASSRPT